MDNTLLCSKSIQYILENNAEIQEIVGSDTHKIFPLLQPDSLKFPFIVHSRTGISVEYTKDAMAGIGWSNTINYTVSCVSNDYVQCLTLANAVRHALEGVRYKSDDIAIYPIELITVSEYTTDNDAYVEELQFRFMAD